MKKSVLYAIAVLSLVGCAGAQTNLGGPSTRVTVVNRSSQDFCHLYVATPGTSSWSADMLDTQRRASDLIHPGERTQVNMPTGTWDIHVQGCEHDHGFTVTRVEVQPGATIEMRPPG